MSKWTKKVIDKDFVKAFAEKYNCSLLDATILARRGMTDGKKMLYVMEKDLRWTHNEFLFEDMQAAVERISSAIDEKEKVMIFGDRDADGITATTLLYSTLHEMGCDVDWRVPLGDEIYGLTEKAVRQFGEAGVTLLIAVDCGISNAKEIKIAQEYCMDAIVVDHHDVPSEIPAATAILNPKMPDTKYPFDGLSGCAVTFKLCQALRFSKTEFYNQQICLLNCRPLSEGTVAVEAIKMINFCETARIFEIIDPAVKNSLQQEKLVNFLEGEYIFAWDKDLQTKSMRQIFGNNVDFDLFDMQAEISTLFPSLAKKSLLRLSGESKIAKYSEKGPSEIDTFFNVFITYLQTKLGVWSRGGDLQLVAISILADMMPLQDENRILVRAGLKAMSEKPREGVMELLQRKKLLGGIVGSVDVEWSINPMLNASGRLGKSDIAVKLFVSGDPVERNAFADSLLAMNEERKAMSFSGMQMAKETLGEQLTSPNQKMLFVFDTRIPRGVCGLVASSLTEKTHLPAIVVTNIDEKIATGSVRSDAFTLPDIMAEFADLFANFGGHAHAAGFSCEIAKLPLIQTRFQKYFDSHDAQAVEDVQKIDAELTGRDISPNLLKTLDALEPYGTENPPIVFATKRLRVADAILLGKKDSRHLKLTLEATVQAADGRREKRSISAFWWFAADKYGVLFKKGDFVDVLYTIGRDIFNSKSGVDTLQVIIKDLRQSDV